MHQASQCLLGEQDFSAFRAAQCQARHAVREVTGVKVTRSADLVLVDMEKGMEVRDENTWTKVGWSPFHEKELFGWPILTMVAGVPVFKRDLDNNPKGEILVPAGGAGKPLLFE